MKKNPLVIGDRIKMTHVASAMGRVLSDNIYTSQVLDFDEVRTVKIAMPISEGKIVPLEIGDDYDLVFYTKAGLYQCTARVLKRYTEERMHVMDLAIQTELVKYQRRQYYRLDCMMTFRYKFPEEEEGSCWKEGMITDISGGGIHFQCREEIEKDSHLEVKIPLSFPGEIVPIQFQTNVIECKRMEMNHTSFEIRGEFVEVSNIEREKLIQFIFEEQKRRMRKE